MKTDNELIAEFMGIPIFRRYNLWDTSKTGKPIYGLASCELLYDSSWDWLMPVVEKIESLGYTVEIANSDYQIRKTGDTEAFIFHYGPDRPKIKAVYEAVVAFIELYNQQEQ